MRLNLYRSWGKRVAKTCIAMLFVCSTSLAQTGYIYLHKRALNEENSPNFTYSITGGPTALPTITLSDQPTPFLTPVVSLGGDGGGGLWAAGGTANAAGYYPIYYRAPNSSTWTQSFGFLTDIDGGASGTRIGVAGGGVYYYNGTSESNITYNLSGVVQVSDSWNGTQYALQSNNQLYRKATAATTWTAVGLSAKAVDAIPNTNRIAYIQTNNTVATANNDGTGVVSLGDPDGSTATISTDVAVSGDGTIFALEGNNYLYRYTGTGWVQEQESRTLRSPAGGPGSQIWGAQSNALFRIYSRTVTANYIADETIRTSPNDNSALLALAPGTYTITENAVANWNLNAIEVYQNAPAVSPSTSVPNRTATIAVRAGEVVHVVYENQLVQTTTITNTCSTSATFTENFGTGTDYGPVLTGLTSFHKASAGYGYGYYALIRNTSLMGGYTGNYDDHTPGDVNGRMLAVDATTEKGTFYRRRFTGLIPGSRYTFAAWTMNVNTQSFTTGAITAPDIPNVNFEVYDPATGTLINSASSGNLPQPGVWKQTTFVFTATQTQLDLVLRNNTTGSGGNDLAIDDITFGVAIPDPIALKSDASCTAGGSITVTSPVSSEYEYSLNGTTYQTSPVFTSLTPGSYSVTARYTGGSCVSQPVAVTITASICGSVLNDGNGLSDNTVNTSGTGAASPLDGTNVGGTALYVTLLNSSGVAIATVPVTSSGTYSFTGVANGSYSVVLSTNPAGSTTPSLPASYTNTGENIGAGTGSDGTPNGILTGITVGASSVTNANFGINKAPTVTAGVASPQPNPGGTATVPVSSTLFSGTDQEDGAYPNNLTGRTVTLSPATNGTLYYNGSPVSTTQIITNFDPTKVSLDPAATGATTGTGGASPDPTFTYSVADNAGVYAPPATIRMPFTTPVVLASISGNVLNDANGLTDNTVNGTGVNGPSLPVYVSLVSGGTVVATVPVDASGAYSFSSVTPGSYSVVLTTNSAGSATPSVPTSWTNTGENIGTGSSNDGTPDGILPVSVSGSTPVTQANFGIEQLPTPGSGTATVANSGGTNPVTVPPTAFTNTVPSSDVAPGTVTAIRIPTFPTNTTSLTINGTVYTPVTFPTGGVVVPTDGNGSPTVPILVDPTNDSQPVSIPIKAIDNAGKESTATGTAVINFTPTVPDLTPIIYARPSTVYNTTPVTVVVDVVELLGVPTSSTVTVRVTKDAKMSLSFDPAANTIDGRSVQNSLWSFDGSSNPNYYIFTTTSVVPAGDKLTFGLSGVLTPGATTGTLTVSSVIIAGSGGEVRFNNNIDADKIDYFQQ